MASLLRALLTLREDSCHVDKVHYGKSCMAKTWVESPATNRSRIEVLGLVASNSHVSALRSWSSLSQVFRWHHGPQSTTWPQPHEASKARGTQLGPTGFLTQRNYEVANARYLKLLNCGVICYLVRGYKHVRGTNLQLINIRRGPLTKLISCWLTEALKQCFRNVAEFLICAWKRTMYKDRKR